MIFSIRIVRSLVLLISYSLLLSSCIGSSAVIYEYTLSPVQPDSPGDAAATVPPLSLLVMPVILPPQLDRTGIVTRSKENRMTTSTTHLWAGNLQDQITAILADDIRRQASGSTIQIYPGSRYSTQKFLLEVTLLRFDGNMRNDFTCTAIWTLSDNQEGTFIQQNEFSTSVSVDSKDFSGYARAASTALGRLSTNIQNSLQDRRLP